MYCIHYVAIRRSVPQLWAQVRAYTSVQVLLGILERGRALTQWQAPQGGAAGSCEQVPDK